MSLLKPMVTRHKPTTEQRAATHAAMEDDYAKLAQVVVKAIATKQKDVILKLPYFVNFGDDFPHGIIVRKDDEYNYYKAKVFKLADFLYEKGALPGNAKFIVASMRKVNILVGEVERALDCKNVMLYNDVSVELDNKEDKND